MVALWHAVIQYKPLVQSETLGIEARAAVNCQQLTLFSFFFSLPLVLFCSLFHSNESTSSFSLNSFTCFISSVSFFFYTSLPHLHPSLGNVPPSQFQPPHLLMISLISLNCCSLTNNDPQSICYTKAKNLTRNSLPLVNMCDVAFLLTHTLAQKFLCLLSTWWCQRLIVGFGRGQLIAKWLQERLIIPLFEMGPAGAKWKM